MSWRPTRAMLGVRMPVTLVSSGAGRRCGSRSIVGVAGRASIWELVGISIVVFFGEPATNLNCAVVRSLSCIVLRLCRFVCQEDGALCRPGMREHFSFL